MVYMKRITILLKQDWGQLYSAIWYIKLNPFVVDLQQKDNNTFKQVWISFCNGICLIK